MQRDRSSHEPDDHDPRLERLEAEARHASERFRLYRARSRGPSPTSRRRLDELERESDRAAERYRRALTVAGGEGRPR